MSLVRMRLKSSRPSRRRLVISVASFLAAAGLFLAGEPVADAQPGVGQSGPATALPGPPSPGGMGEQVAAALYNRGMVLFELGDIASAKTLFGESLERSPDGSRAADALGMLRKCNEKLGIKDLDAGRPAAGSTGEGPLDPYAPDGQGGDTPLDPYATPEGPLDPYAVDGGAGDPHGAGDPGGFPTPGPVDEREGDAQTELMISGGLTGFMTGLAVVGPFDEDEGGSGDLKGAAIPVGLLVAAGGVYLGHYLNDKYERPGGKAVSYGAVWGMYNFALLGNVFTGENTEGNDIYKSMAIGGLAGGALGHFYVNSYDPTEGQVAVVNTGSLLGTSAGLFLGAAMDPPRGDAYSLNMALGSMAGIGAGIYFRDDLVASPRRMTMVNLGALGGAVLPWAVVYPFVDGADGGDHQAAGFLSTLTMAGGAYLAWRLTEDDEPEEDVMPEEFALAAPAMLQRSPDGNWGLGTPMPRPINNQQLAPATGLALGADILSGRF